MNPFYKNKMTNLEEVFGKFSLKNWLLPIENIRNNTIIQQQFGKGYNTSGYPIDETGELGSFVKEV